MIHLTVVAPFDSYQRGDEIAEPDAVNAILAGPHETNVVKREVAAPSDEPKE